MELMSVPKSQQKTDGSDSLNLLELLLQKDSEIKSVLQLGKLFFSVLSYRQMPLLSFPSEYTSNLTPEIVKTDRPVANAMVTFF